MKGWSIFTQKAHIFTHFYEKMQKNVKKCKKMPIFEIAPKLFNHLPINKLQSFLQKVLKN